MNFFGSFSGGGSGRKTKSSSDPQALGKEWKRNLAKEIRNMDRDITKVQREETKAMKECQQLAKKGRVDAAKILAKEVVNTRKAIERMHTAKAQLGSVQSNLQVSMSTLKIQGVMGKSTEIMKSMNKLVSVKEISETMGNMAREMERAGLVEEIIGETMDALEPEGLDSQADVEVDKIMTELASGTLAPASAAPTTEVKQPAAAPVEAEAEAEDDQNTQELLSRLQAL